MAIEIYLDMLNQSLAVTEDEEERQYLQLEIELLCLELEAIGAERTGNWALVAELQRQIWDLEARLDTSTAY